MSVASTQPAAVDANLAAAAAAGDFNANNNNNNENNNASSAVVDEAVSLLSTNTETTTTTPPVPAPPVFSAASYLLARPSAEYGAGFGRPSMLHSLSYDTIVKHRIGEYFNQNAIVYNVGLPIFMQWNKIMEEHIRETDEWGHNIESRALDEYRSAAAVAAPQIFFLYSTVAVQTLICAQLLKNPSPFRDSIVYESDLAPRLPSYYMGNIFEMCFLPRTWAATLMGPAATKEEIDYFESPVSLACAFEDNLKRHSIQTFSTCLVQTFGSLAMFIPLVRKILAKRELKIPDNYHHEKKKKKKEGEENDNKKEEKKKQEEEEEENEENDHEEENEENNNKKKNNKKNNNNNNNKKKKHLMSLQEHEKVPHYIWKEPEAPSVKDTASYLLEMWLRAGVDVLGGAAFGALGTYMAGGKGGSTEYWMTKMPGFLMSAIALGRLGKQTLEDIAERVKNMKDDKQEGEEGDDNSSNNNNQYECEEEEEEEQGMLSRDTSRMMTMTSSGGFDEDAEEYRVLKAQIDATVARMAARKKERKEKKATTASGATAAAAAASSSS